MDGRTLSDIIGSGNWSLIQPAQQAFDLSQQKARQDLQTSLQGAQRAQELHPLEMAAKKASTGYNEALTKQVNSSMENQMKERFFKLAEQDRADTVADMEMRYQLAQAALANGGVLPLHLQSKVKPEEMSYYTGSGLQKTLQYTDAFIRNAPKWKMEEQKEKARFDREKQLQELRNKGTLAAAGVRSNTTSSAQGKLSLEQYLVSLNQRIAQMPDGPEKQQLQAEADRTEVQILRKMVAGRQAAQAGQINPAATAEQGKIIANPPFEATPTPRNKTEWTPESAGYKGWK